MKTLWSHIAGYNSACLHPSSHQPAELLVWGHSGLYNELQHSLGYLVKPYLKIRMKKRKTHKKEEVGRGEYEHRLTFLWETFKNIFFFWDRVLHRPGWPQTHYVDEDNLPASMSQVLGLQKSGLLNNILTVKHSESLPSGQSEHWFSAQFSLKMNPYQQKTKNCTE